MQQTILITGANQGIGLAFTRQYAEAGHQVIACYRDPNTMSELQSLAQQYPAIQLEQMDVTQSLHITDLYERLEEKKTSIDILINNAGIFGLPNLAFGQNTMEHFQQVLLTNTIAPFKIAETFIKLIKQSNTKLIVTISSRLGSITDTDSARSYAYRASKAAINMLMKTAALALKDSGVRVLLLHPGWVKTRMGGDNALISVDESVSGMRDVITQLGPDESGVFYSYQGQPIDW